jgi:hypothetical protein
MSNGMAFAPNSEGLRSAPVLRADFTYSIMPNTISITDTNLGKLSVTNDIEAILRRIEYLYQGSVAAFKIMYRDSDGIWDGIRRDRQSASFFALRETDEQKAHEKLLSKPGHAA